MKTKLLFSRAMLLLATCMLMLTKANAQESIGGTPLSFTSNELSRSRVDVPVYTTSAIPLQQLQREDSIFDHGEYPYRFGYGFDVNIDLKKSGVKQTLADGSSLWRMKVHCPGALSVNFLYSKYHLPDGAKLYIYNNDRSIVIGAFTSFNNTPTQRFGTMVVDGEAVTLEYSEPANVAFSGEIVIGKIVHGYRNWRGGKPKNSKARAGDCNVNINCPEAAGWEDQKKAVARILLNGSGWCTGTMLNNTSQDDRPYFLTANHCLDGLDAVNNPDASGWLFHWNYESSTCSGTTGPTNQTTGGATLRANNEASDFALFELHNKPSAAYNVYYAGWDRTNNPATGVVGIHHPAADIKKFSKDNSTLTHHEPAFWLVPSWDIGVTEGGSSGSAIFNLNKRVVGQLLGGWSGCGSDNQSDIYGKIWYSWDQGGSTPQRRLKEWLDPANTGLITLDGKYQGGTGNNSPVATITSPSNNSTYTAPATVSINATASDSDGSVTKVQFYVNGIFLGEDASAPYTYTWSGVTAGSYNVTAVATDDKGATGTSSVIVVKVNMANAVATVYEHCDYDPNGYSIGLAIGDYTTAQLTSLGIEDDDISSLRVQSGYEIIVYTQNDFQGTSQTYGSDVPCLTVNNLNDAVSSIRVRTVNNNTAPTAVITAPANNSTFAAPATITITATASDANGTVSKVTFYNGGIPIGEDLTSPYSLTWSNVNAGTYAVTAVATDNQGATGTSSAVNLVVEEVDNSVVTVFQHCNYTEDGYSEGLAVGSYTRSQLMNQGVEDDDLSSLRIQSGYEIVVYTEDNFTGTTQTFRSDIPCLTVFDLNDEITSLVVRAVTTNTAPIVNITSPANNSTFNAPATITVSVNASDADGTVSKVELYIGTQKIDEALSEPYTITWSGVSAGSYTLTAIATDNENASTTSLPVNIVVNAVDDAIATVYQHCNYSASGYAINLGVGSYNLSDLTALGVMNNDLSSLKVKSGYEVVLYNNDNFQGTSLTVKQDMSCFVSSNFNDITTSLIVRPVTVENNRPVVEITSPLSGSEYNSPASIIINADASDSDGNIVKIEFFNGAEKLGEVTALPYTYTWTGVAAGNFSLTAIATDNSGNITSSEAVIITVVASTGACDGIAEYSTAGGYVAGSLVKNNGTIYKCKPWPYSGWCNGAAWAYEPGVGAYWQDAWTPEGSCGSTPASIQTSKVSISPNPASDYITVDLEVDNKGLVEFAIIDAFGYQLLSGLISHGDQIDISNLGQGFYTLKVIAADKVLTKKLLKQ